MPGETRARLTESMLRYDALGHALWRDVAAKSQLALVKGGRHAG
jgi:hypothetical protein